MDVYTQIIISATLYKLASLLVGALFAFLGYKLFMAGIWGHSGDLEAQYKESKIVLTKAAPGTFFALFGAIIIGFTVFKGLDYKFGKISQSDVPVITSKAQEEEQQQKQQKILEELPNDLSF